MKRRFVKRHEAKRLRMCCSSKMRNKEDGALSYSELVKLAGLLNARCIMERERADMLAESLEREMKSHTKDIELNTSLTELLCSCKRETDRLRADIARLEKAEQGAK